MPSSAWPRGAVCPASYRTALPRPCVALGQMPATQPTPPQAPHLELALWQRPQCQPQRVGADHGPPPWGVSEGGGLLPLAVLPPQRLEQPVQCLQGRGCGTRHGGGGGGRVQGSGGRWVAVAQAPSAGTAPAGCVAGHHPRQVHPPSTQKPLCSHSWRIHHHASPRSPPLKAASQQLDPP